MDKRDFEALGRGDLIRHKATGLAETYIVSVRYGDRVTALASVDIINPIEWDLVLKANYSKPKPKLVCSNCQDPMPGKLVHVNIHRGNSYCAYCGRRITSGG